MSGKWRFTVYDPILIILQIITLVSLFYFSLTIFIYFVDLIFDFDVNLSQLFSYKLIGLNTGYNFFITFAFIINSLAGYYFIHLILCWIYNQQFPNTFSWWILQIICMSIMCITAEYMCANFESKPIPLLQKEEI